MVGLTDDIWTNPNQPNNYMEIKGIPEHIIEREKHLFPAIGKFRRMVESIREPNMIAGTVTLSLPDVKCDQIKFHVPNFIKYAGDFIYCIVSSRRILHSGRLRLIEEEWMMTLDAITVPKRSYNDSNDPLDRVKETGGFIITHTGILKRKDESAFALSDGINYLDAIYFFISFMRGAWCGPILSLGVGSKKVVWQDGVKDRLSPWSFERSWVDGSSIGGIEKLFQNFMMKWRDKKNKDAIMSLIQWYIEANLNAGGTEGSIILVHSALELLANMSGYNGSNRKVLRKLVNDLGIGLHLFEKHANLKRVYDEAVGKVYNFY